MFNNNLILKLNSFFLVVSSAFFLDGTYKVCYFCWHLGEITVTCKFENCFPLSSDKVVYLS